MNVEQQVSELLSSGNLNDYERQLLTEVQSRFEDLKHQRDCERCALRGAMKEYGVICDDYATLNKNYNCNKKLLTVVEFLFILMCGAVSYLIGR